MRYQLAILICLICWGQSCTYDIPEPIPSSEFTAGSADFQRIAMLGGSQFAGFMDGALYDEGQNNSVGAILARQININNPNPATFQQPDINSPNGFNPTETVDDVRGKYFMRFIRPGSFKLFKGTNSGELPSIYNGSVPNNFSIPNLRTNLALDPELSINPFYERIATEPGTSILLDQVIDFDPSLALLQMGWDDVLPYAISGLTGKENAPLAELGTADLTPIEVFKTAMEQIVDRLINETNAAIIISNIPDVTGFPFFNTVSHIASINGTEAGLLQAFYRNYNINVSRYNGNADIPRPLIQFFSDDPPNLWTVVVEDPSLPEILLEDGSLLPKYRQMEEGEHVLWSVPILPSAQDEGFGTFQPLPKSFFFTEQDKVAIKDLIDEFNKIISDLIASNSRIKLLDCHHIYKEWLMDGTTEDGVQHSYDFMRTGIFSSDGLTLNQRGSALLSNRVVDLINENYGSNIQWANVNDFSGNEFVNDFD